MDDTADQTSGEREVARPLAVSWLGHATSLIELDGVRLITDPVLRRRVGPLRRTAPDAPLVGAVDAVLLSHLHADHADVASLRAIDGAPTVIGPRGAARWLARKGFAHSRELAIGERCTVGAVTVEATDARHDGQRWRFGHHADSVGFLIAGTQAVYFAGDTDLFSAMGELAGRVDIALLPVAGWGPTVGAGHLDAERAARAAALIEPRVAIPIHWGTLALPSASRAADGAPARDFAARAAELAPDVEVRVLAVGERTQLAAAP